MEEPIRVLQVFGKLNRGGAETMIMNLYNHIDRSIVQFDFVIHTNEVCSYEDEIKSLGGYIYRIPRYSGKNHFQYIKSWHELLSKHPEYNIIHGHVRSTASIYIQIAKKYGRITISHSHSISSGNGISGIAKKILQYPIRFKSDYLFACSLSAGRWLFGEKAVRSQNFYILKNAIDTKKYKFDELKRKNIRDKLELKNKLVIGHVGRFSYEKNHEFLINLFKEINKNNKNTFLILVGEGVTRKTIEQMVTDLDLNNNIVFTGEREDIPDLLQAMDVFVLPSLFEGLGLALIEAQAMGLKCFTSADVVPHDVKIIESLEFIHLNKGYKYWAERIANIEDNYVRNSMIEDVKLAGYDVDETSKWLESFYLKLIRSSFYNV